MHWKVFCVIACALPAAYGQAIPGAECPKPEWPLEARRYEIDGNTILRYAVGADGKAQSAVVAKSSGWGILDDAAMNNLARCVFRKPTEQGEMRPTQYNWKFAEDDSIRPRWVPGSCTGTQRFGMFKDGDKSPSNQDGIVLRMVLANDGRPFNVGAEAKGLPPELVADAKAFVQTCRFAFEPDAKGHRTDTAYGKLMLK